MAKKTRVEDIDTSFIINSFREDDYSIPPHARSLERDTKVSDQTGQEKKSDIPTKKKVPKKNPNERERA